VSPLLSGRLGRFLLVGAAGVAVNSIVLFALHQLGGLPVAVASAVAVEVAIVNNYLLNNRWTFGEMRLSLGRFLQFNTVSLGGLLLTTSTVWLLTTTFGVQYLAANLVGIGFATAWNFIANVRWTWRHQERPTQPSLNRA